MIYWIYATDFNSKKRLETIFIVCTKIYTDISFIFRQFLQLLTYSYAERWSLSICFTILSKNISQCLQKRNNKLKFFCCFCHIQIHTFETLLTPSFLRIGKFRCICDDRVSFNNEWNANWTPEYDSAADTSRNWQL